MEDIIETQENHEIDNEFEHDKFLDDSLMLELSRLVQNNMIIDDKQGIDIAEFLLKNLQ